MTITIHVGTCAANMQQCAAHVQQMCSKYATMCSTCAVNTYNSYILYNKIITIETSTPGHDQRGWHCLVTVRVSGFIMEY